MPAELWGTDGTPFFAKIGKKEQIYIYVYKIGVPVKFCNLPPSLLGVADV
jgi:hypothetical protein